MFKQNVPAVKNEKFGVGEEISFQVLIHTFVMVSGEENSTHLCDLDLFKLHCYFI